MFDHGKLTFKAIKDNKEHMFAIGNWYSPIDVEQSKWCNNQGTIEIKLRKQNKHEKEWPWLNKYYKEEVRTLITPEPE